MRTIHTVNSDSHELCWLGTFACSPVASWALLKTETTWLHWSLIIECIADNNEVSITSIDYKFDSQRGSRIRWRWCSECLWKTIRILLDSRHGEFLWSFYLYLTFFIVPPWKSQFRDSDLKKNINEIDQYKSFSGSQWLHSLRLLRQPAGRCWIAPYLHRS